MSFAADEAGETPAEIPLTGSVTLAPLVGALALPTALEPVTAVAQHIVCPVVNGWLCAPGTTDPGVSVAATGQPEGEPDTVQWRAVLSLRDAAPLPPYVFEVPDGGEVDLSTAVPVLPVPGIVTVVSRTDALAAAASALAAQDALDAITGDVAGLVDVALAAELPGQVSDALAAELLDGGVIRTEKLPPLLPQPDGLAAAASVPWRDETDTFRWGSATEVVARALGWKIADDYGLDLTGATTHTAAQVQAWLDAAAVAGVKAYAAGTLKVSGTMVIKGDADLHQLTVNYTAASGVAVQVGAGPILFAKTIDLPSVTATAKTVPGWDQVAGTVGVKVVNLNTCHLSFPRIRNFETNLLEYGQGTGSVHNTWRMGFLDNGKRNHALDADAGGWVNSNTYLGGRYFHESAEGTNVPGSRQILCTAGLVNPINNNVWTNASVEGNTAEYHLDAAGSANRFEQCRWEVTGGGRVRWQANAVDNVIDGGYRVDAILETFQAGAGRNHILGTQAVKMQMNAGMQIENSASNANPILTCLAAGAISSGADPATAYVAQVTANLWKMKRSTDAFDRLQFDPINGRVYWGTGTAAPAWYIAPVTGYGLGVNGGHLGFLPTNTYDIGASNLRPRDVHVGRGIGVHGSTPPTSKPSVTGSRGGNAALASLLTALASYGLITDSSTV